MQSIKNMAVFAMVSRLLVSPILLIGCLLILPGTAPHTRASEAAPGGSAEAQQSEDAVPEGLTGSDWTSIRNEYERHRHAAVFVDGEFRARNPGQQWLTHFDGRGFTVEPNGAGWRWGLELQSYGFPGHERAVSGQAKMTAQDDRVTYDWDAGLREWFVNDRNGLEHGFTLVSRPPGTCDAQLGAGDPRLGEGEWLELRLAVRGGLRAQGHADGQGVSFVNEQGHTIVNYAGLKVWDADHRVLPARIDADVAGLRLIVDERGARYPLTIDPIAQQAYLKASNTGAGDNFGDSVAVSGDTVVVGAPGEASSATGVDGNQADNSAVASGAAYVFVKGGGVWTQQAYLKASNTDVFDWFGLSVAVSGDTAVVGASSESSNAAGVDGNQADNSADNSGAAYVFVRDGGGVWTQQAYLKASNTDAGDFFSRSVAVSGDTVVVGAWGEDSSATGVNGDQADNSANVAGAAYVFVRDGGGDWTQQAYLKASNTDAGDVFGFPVAVSGDTVVVGADREDSNATGVNGNGADNSAGNSGAAYVFVRDGGNVWTQQAYLKASNTDELDEFGFSVGVSGDTVVVGAFREDSNSTGVNGDQADNSAGDSGAAYVFVRDGASVWTQQAYLKASNTGAVDWFGFSVGVSGDTVVVGAYREDSNSTGVNGNQADNSDDRSGAAYVFILPSVCGNGAVEGPEECDDGDTDDGDGCSSTCTVETGSACTGQPSVCGPDCNANGVPDECDLDCMALGGACDLAGCGLSDDCDSDGIPDECEPDCNGDLIPDDCEIADCLPTDPACQDCNDNGVPDECDPDCDGDMIPDDCEQCPETQQPQPESKLGLDCQIDADCPNESVCVNGECYVPKSKYISLRPGNPGQMVALRVTMISNAIFPALVGSQWWVTPSTGNEPGETFRLGCEAWYQDWSAAPVVIHVGDRHITSGAVYRVEAVHIDCDNTEPCSYSPPLDLPTVQLFGDCVGPFDVAYSPPNGAVNLEDVFAAVLAFQGAPAAPNREWVDVDGDVPNGVVNLADAFVIVLAFQSGGVYPYPGPVPCP